MGVESGVRVEKEWSGVEWSGVEESRNRTKK